MKQKSFMQQALGEQWQQLPVSLQRHYQNDASGKNQAQGHLDIDYPGFMQFPLTVLRLMGALVNRQGKNIPTLVNRTFIDEREYWHRIISFPDGHKIHFKSLFTYAGNNELIEYINPYLGLKMAVTVEGDRLIYQGKGYVLKLGKWKIPIHESLALGHVSIVETGVSEQKFAMDFRLVHPLLGQIFSYAGVFVTV